MWKNRKAIDCEALSLNSRISIKKRAYARVGLIGNPSDGFFGKTISLSIKNFWADVTIEESPTVCLVPHSQNDPTEFNSLSDLHCISSRNGYLGGLRLLQATCKKFYGYCMHRNICLHQRNFTLSYDTTIPRQVGLAGSSAIVTATLKALMSFYGVTDSDFPKPMQPQFILEVEEEELMINAGLQDRVVQVYEGLVYMDFSKELMNKQGYGNYVSMNFSSSEFPKLFLSYVSQSSDSGKMHSDVSARYTAGDEEILDGMSELAEITEKARMAIEKKKWRELLNLMNRNFSLRRKMYGDKVLGKDNLRMVQIGLDFGAAVKLPGSGGAVVGHLNEHLNMEQLKRQYESEGYAFVEVVPHLGDPLEIG